MFHHQPKDTQLIVGYRDFLYSGISPCLTRGLGTPRPRDAPRRCDKGIDSSRGIVLTLCRWAKDSLAFRHLLSGDEGRQMDWPFCEPENQ